MNVTYGRRVDFIPLMVFDNEEDAWQFAKAWELTHCAHSNKGAEENN